MKKVFYKVLPCGGTWESFLVCASLKYMQTSSSVEHVKMREQENKNKQQNFLIHLVDIGI